MGFQKLQNKRRNMTMIYKTLNDQIDVLIINRDREIIYNPLEDLDQDEKLAVLTDIINSDPIQNQLNVCSQKWEAGPSKLFDRKGQIDANTIGHYHCKRYKVHINAQVI